MLRKLDLRGVGPSRHFKLEFGDRLSVLTGDNGLGKSFILDLAWWALTGTWAAEPAAPRRDSGPPRIAWTVTGKNGHPSSAQVRFNRQTWDWPWRTGRPPMPGLTLYVRVDGSFSVWDPARNYWRDKDEPDRPDAFHFRPDEVWNGLDLGPNKPICNGLIRDWVSWQKDAEGKEAVANHLDHSKATKWGRRSPFRLLTAVLDALSPAPLERLHAGRPERISPIDSRLHPTLDLSYGRVAVVHASAGIKRILGLAYLLIWAWHEHLEAVALTGAKPDNRIIVLIDEVETHLHPKWQRMVVPALLTVLRHLAPKVQAIVTTHSPMVLASIEPEFDPEFDKLFLFELDRREVTLKELPWAKQGDAIGWLTSEVFGLAQARSIEAERAIEAAEAFMRGSSSSRTEKEITQELRRHLSDMDPFWPRWIAKDPLP